MDIKKGSNPAALTGRLKQKMLYPARGRDTQQILTEYAAVAFILIILSFMLVVTVNSPETVPHLPPVTLDQISHFFGGSVSSSLS